MRTEAVQHEFVNTTLCMPERCQFQVDASRWQPRSEGAAAFETLIVALVRELGAGLDIALYEEALAYLLGSAGVPHEVAVASDDGSPLGGQPMRSSRPTAHSNSHRSRPINPAVPSISTGSSCTRRCEPSSGPTSPTDCSPSRPFPKSFREPKTERRS